MVIIMKFTTLCYIEKNGMDTMIYTKKLWHNNFKDRNTIEFALELMLMFYYDVMKYLANSNDLFFGDKLDIVQAVANKNDIISISKKIECIDEIKNNVSDILPPYLWENSKRDSYYSPTSSTHAATLSSGGILSLRYPCTNSYKVTLRGLSRIT